MSIATKLIPATALILAALGCAGGARNPVSGDHAGQLNGACRISPQNPTVGAGQSLNFSARSPWGSGAHWTVLPASGGTVDAGGTFTASPTPGQYQLVAMWNGDVRYTATTTVTVVPLPPPSLINPALVQASGAAQTGAGGHVRNNPVVGEAVPARTATNAADTLQVRHGFDPSIAH